MKRCKCSSKSPEGKSGEVIATWQRVPIGDYPAHTSFVLFIHHDCGGYYGFPDSNFQMFIDAMRGITDVSCKEIEARDA